MIEIIAFDADDTLWENEALYIKIQEQLAGLLAAYGTQEEILAALYKIEMKNMPLYGYGIKAFGLSLIETAITVSQDKIRVGDIKTILDMVNHMLTYTLPVYPGVESTLQQLSKKYPLMMITKGDLLDQEMKINRSGLRGYFKHIEVVAKKETDTYQTIMERHQIPPDSFLMVGNSLRSDILPVVSLGGIGVLYVNEVSWAHENEIDPTHKELAYHSIHSLPELIPLLDQLNLQ
jgi:putative hydrolase of the HAD superfamily